MSAGMNLGMNLPSADLSGFDPDYYLRANPDVAAAGVDPTQHYLLFGKNEGRAPNEAQAKATGAQAAPQGMSAADRKSETDFANNPYGFDVDYYLRQRPDVKAANVDPLQHYLSSGINEGTPRNAYAAGTGMGQANIAAGIMAPPPATQPTLNPNDPASWAAWQQKAAAQTQGLNRMPNVAPATNTLSADPLAVRAMFYPMADIAATQYGGRAANAATTQDQILKNFGMRL